MGEQTRFSLKWIAVWTMILDHGMKALQKGKQLLRDLIATGQGGMA